MRDWLSGCPLISHFPGPQAQGALGAGIGIGNFGILGLQRALGAGIGIGNFGILITFPPL